VCMFARRELLIPGRNPAAESVVYLVGRLTLTFSSPNP
jgi:hypothetical protein